MRFTQTDLGKAKLWFCSQLFACVSEASAGDVQGVFIVNRKQLPARPHAFRARASLT